jgi:putative ABC transport system permease protein
MRFISEIGAVTAVGLRSVPQRLGTSMVIVTGVAAVVLVLVGAMAVARGFEAAASKAGSPSRAVVLMNGSEALGRITREAVVTVLNAPGIRKTANNKPVVSAEMLTFVPLPDPKTGLNSYVAVRGVGQQIFALRPELKVIEGRAFRPGTHELLVGRGVAGQMRTLSVGAKVPLQDGDWVVTGIFEERGDSRESEVLADADTLLASLQRNVFNSVSVALEDGSGLQRLQSALSGDPSLRLQATREDEYVANTSRPISSLLKVIARALGALMAVGAMFAALNTLYTAVSTRTLEIATLRAIGFGPGAVAGSVVAESLLLALAGALLGALLAWLLFDGATISALTGLSPSPLTFGLTVTPILLSIGVAWAAAIALVGGALAAVRATRIPVSQALRLV